jgi:hypothetical protein
MLRILCFAFGVLLLTACEKYRLKQPAFISFSWGYENNSETTALNNFKFYLTDFTVTGTRAEGDDVFMTKPTPSDVQFSVTGNSSIGLGIDVPVGEYKTFVLTMNIPKKSPGLILNGTRYNGTESVAVKVEWTDEVSINFSTDVPFELKKKKSYQMELGIDVTKLFEDISENHWANATISNENGVPTYVINEINNQILFTKINNALEDAVYIKTP